MSVRLVVLADTHMPRRGRDLPSQVLEAIAQADMIVHLGDFTSEEAAERLERLGPMVAVHGNNDAEELKRRYPARQELALEGHRLVLIHGDVGGRTALAAARAETEADMILFGHSHRPYLTREAARILFNPGSPTDRRTSPYRSYGLAEVGASIEARVVPLL